jgi:hypothetical protein
MNRPSRSVSSSQAPRFVAFGLIALVLFFLVTGCIPSINPIFEEKDLITDPALVGTWSTSESEDAETWTFETTDTKAYRLTIRQGEESSLMIANLVAVGEHRFLDLSPASEAIESTKLGAYYRCALVPAHLFPKVTLTNEQLTVQWMDEDWLGELLRKEPAILSHVWRKGKDDALILTAQTAELRAFLLKHAANAEAFKGGDGLKRVLKRVPTVGK